jgi:hypothetical protein
MSMFPYPYVAVDAGGAGTVYISLAQRNTPFGRLPEHLQGGKALVVEKRGQRIVHLPAARPEEDATTLDVKVALGDALDAEVDVDLAVRSVLAQGQKDRLKTIQAFQKTLLLNQVAVQMFPGAKVKKAEIEGLEESEEPLGFKLSLTAPKLLRQSGDDYLLRPVLQPSRMVRSFSGKARREHPLHFRSQRVQRDTLRIETGGQFRLERLPASVLLPSALGTFSLVYTAQGDTILVERELTLLPGRLAAAEFPTFVAFCEKVDAAERENVIFRRR